jgi:hypothetical protein
MSKRYRRMGPEGGKECEACDRALGQRPLTCRGCLQAHDCVTVLYGLPIHPTGHMKAHTMGLCIDIALKSMG